MYLGIVLAERGEFDVARRELLTAVEALRGAPSSSRLPLIAAFNALGSLEERSNRPEEARKYYGDALVLAEDRLGPDHPDVATLLNNIGVLERVAGRSEAAIAALERALDIRVRTLAPDHPEISTTRMNLGIALMDTGEYERAIGYLQGAATVLRRNPARERDLAMVLYNLAICHHLRDDFAAAVPVYEEALARAQAMYASDEPALAHYLHGLGVALVELGRLLEARPLLERTLAIRTRKGVQAVDLGELRFALARAVVGQDRGRALELASAARSDYAKDGVVDQVSRVDQWLMANVVR